MQVSLRLFGTGLHLLGSQKRPMKTGIMKTKNVLRRREDLVGPWRLDNISINKEVCLGRVLTLQAESECLSTLPNSLNTCIFKCMSVFKFSQLKNCSYGHSALSPLLTWSPSQLHPGPFSPSTVLQNNFLMHHFHQQSPGIPYY